jgi:integrase
LGPVAGQPWRKLVGLSAVGGARLRDLPARARSGARGSRARSVAAAAAASQPLLVFDAEITALIAAADTLPTPLRRATFGTLIGLLAVTGIRVGEAIALDRGDVDLAAGRLTVRFGKFGKARELALHPSSVEALRRYQRLRDRLAPRTGTSALFVSLAGTRLLYCNVHHAFHRLVRLAGLTPRSASCRPRIHDYADLRVMPTRSAKSLWANVILRFRSA